MPTQCSMCFQYKDTLVKPLPRSPVSVCKACNYKISAVLGFLEYHGASVIYQPPLSKDTPPAPPVFGPPRSKGPKKSQDQEIAPEADQTAP